MKNSGSKYFQFSTIKTLIRKTSRSSCKYYFVLMIFFACSCSPNNVTFEEIEKSLSTTAGNFWIKKYPDGVAENTFKENKTPNKQSQESAEENNSAVEIIWLVPEGRVTKYILRYGTNQNSLDSVIELYSNDLTAVMHPKFGKVYKHIIMGVPGNSKIYYTLQAGNELGLSDPTPIASELSRGN